MFVVDVYPWYSRAPARERSQTLRFVYVSFIARRRRHDGRFFWAVIVQKPKTQTIRGNFKNVGFGLAEHVLQQIRNRLVFIQSENK